MKQWWAIILIAVGIVGGGFWLDRNFARIEKLKAEKCWLTYEIRLTKQKIELARVGKEAEWQLSEKEALLKSPRDNKEMITYHEDLFKKFTDAQKEIADTINCLDRAQTQCSEGDIDTQKCYDQNSSR